ncbi:MAG TPA: DUF1707 and FHA domain-containing protein [Baekduia sp.]|uniref:DUF1707 and FHA domain-containing protein n=1 Tax=Baekduia sp. TaxID=2600305 RepID=UPI002CD24925|nr:DUF1707 and FHA domain-containing protein [Baekduia sp.]HMJ37136.1 DUF1707 and FHA domain-containing protein [Baekduia sp.]
MRIGDRERWQAERRLRASYLRGELSADTFEGRIAVALDAQHAHDLAPLARDLPSPLDRLRLALGRRARRGDGPALVAPAADAGARLVLGRSRSCDVRFVESTVSRCHAELLRVGDGWLLVDRASTNGTWVNGVRVTRTAVCDGDEIRLGTARVVLRT